MKVFKTSFCNMKIVKKKLRVKDIQKRILNNGKLGLDNAMEAIL